VAGLDARELLTSNLAVIERAVGFASRRYRLDPNDAEELAAIVNVKLIDNDYAVLRAYEERSSFATYISVVVQRLALDYCIHVWGKWHASAEARRLGPLAIELDQLLHRDSRTIDEALVILAQKHDGISRQSLQEIAARLPIAPLGIATSGWRRPNPSQLQNRSSSRSLSSPATGSEPRSGSPRSCPPSSNAFPRMSG
jgi:DNA-directed RNA polymerase specialized sigma24 family protein